MKKIMFTMLFGSLSLFADGLQWAKNYEDAKKQAATSNKLIMMVLTQDGCNMCDYMIYVVLKNQDVTTLVESRFIPLEIDIHNGKVPQGFKAYGTPTTYFLDANGNKIGRQLVGAAKPDVFIDYIQKIKK